MRLVQVVQHPRPLVQHVQLRAFAGVLAIETTGRGLGMGRLVEACIGKADAEGPDRLGHVPSHQGHDGAGVHPAGQERAPGHVGAQADAGRVVQQAQELLGPGLEPEVLLALVRQAPPALRLSAAAREPHPGARQHVLQSLPDGPGRRDVVEAQVVVQRLQVQLRCGPTRAQHRQHRLELRREQHLAAVVAPVQRLDADAVARQVHRVFAGVVDGDGEHAVEAPQEGDALALVQAQEHLGVRGRAQRDALRAQLGGQFHVVEDLAVLHQRDAAVVGHQGLVAARQVDDGKPPVAQRHAAPGRLPHAFVIGATVPERTCHAGNLLRRQLAAVTAPVAEDPAHQLAPAPPSRPSVISRMRRSQATEGLRA